jgi:TolB-like protein/DNA-binding SARP family transcriptional activator
MVMDTASASGNGSEARWSLRLFGDFQLTEHPGAEKVTLPGKRERVLLAYLALSPNGRQPRRKLVTLLWGEATDETTLDNLRNSLWNLRKALGDTERQVIASDDRDIVLDAAAFEIDVLAFRRLAAQSGLVDLEEAAKLYSGEFLEGLSIESDEFESWRREEATRCRDQAVDVLNRLMAQLSASGESERAIEAGLRILRLEPLHETAVRSLMRLYAESDRRATAVQLYRALADALKKELGAQPEAATRAVLAEISRGGEERTQAPAAVAAMPAPPSTMARSSDPTREPLQQQFSPAISAPARVSPKKAKTSRLGWIAAGGVAAAAIAFLLLVPFAPSTGPTPTVGPATVVAATPTNAIALAVLPFANLSSDPEQEFFSDGLTEEIGSALARIPDLGIVARTSAFEFKGQNRDIRTIGEQLGATHLIEGSVRKDGNRVRITAQLIKTDDGTHIWSESYDRELIDVFAIQEDIATAISGALRMPLGLAQGERLVANRSIDLESYQQYLRAKPLVRARSRGVPAAIRILEPLVARYPDFAPAVAQLAHAYGLTPNYSRNASIDELRRVVDEYLPKAEAAGRRAIQLDPGLAEGYVSLARVQVSRGKFLLADNLLSKARALDPSYPDALSGYSNLLANVGRVKEALAIKQQLLTLEPYVPSFHVDVAEMLWVNGQNDAAIAKLNGLRSLDVGALSKDLAIIHAAMGHYKEAADILQEGGGGVPPAIAASAVHLLRQAPAAPAPPQSLRRLGTLGFVYLYAGAPVRALEAYEEWAEAGYFATGGADNALLWHHSYAPVRKTERFKAFARATGYVEYWRAKGWPEFCRPTTGDDFVCD